MEKLESTIQIALENMYMLGGMPKPDPNYHQYLQKMINMIMKEIPKQP